MNRGKPGPSTPSHGGSLLRVDLARRSDLWSRSELSEEALISAARAAYSAAGGKGAREVTLVLSCDDEVRTLNRTWAGKDRATNVLSFPAGAAAHGEEDTMLGDIVLACETLEREAAQGGISLQQHASHLVVHGLLHLLGYDHATDAEAAVMEELETEILGKLGYPDPYGIGTEKHALG